MPNRVLCTNCGGKVDVPAGHTRAKVRCALCGYYAEVPPEMRAAAAVDDTAGGGRKPPVEASATGGLRPPPAKTKAKPVVIDPGPNLLDGTQDEDDDRPYAVPGDGTKKCPACHKELPLDATFCVHCGGDLTAGKKKKKRTFQPVDRTWESVAPLSLRVKAFLAIQAVNALMVVNILMTGYNTVAVGTVVFNVFLQAFLVGTFDTLTVRRTAKGTATLTKQWRVCFLPQPTFRVDWKKSHGLGVVALHDPWIMDWGMMLLLLSAGCGQFAAYAFGGGSLIGCVIVVPLAFGPAAAWYWFVIRPERFNVTLCDEYGSTNETVFHTTSRDTADEICRTINDATGLWYRPVM